MTASTAVAAVLLQQVVVTGVVRDSVALTPLEYAHVTVASADGGRTATRVTDRYGAFVIPEVAASREGVRVAIALAGYAPWERAFAAPPEDPLVVLLAAVPVELEGLEVAGGGARPGDPLSGKRDGYVVDGKMVHAVPAVVEADVLRAAELSPAASSPSDFTSVPYLRGVPGYGTPMTLDGVRVFNPFRLAGLFSSLPPEFVDKLEVIPGSAGEGIGAGSLSGVMSASTREGSRERRRMTAAVGVASANAAAEGPLGRNSSYLVIGRRSYLDVYTRALEKLEWVNSDTPYHFQDLHAKLTADLGGLERLSVTAYLASETYVHGTASELGCFGLGDLYEEDDPVSKSDWGHGGVSAQYRGRVGPTGVVDATLGHSWFRVANHSLDGCWGGDAPFDTTWVGWGMRETLAEVRGTWRIRRATTVVAAAQASGFEMDHHSRDLDGGLARIAAYWSVDAPLGSGFAFRGGLRADRFGGLQSTASGYAELGYALGDWSVRASAAMSRQALASLRDEEAPDAVLPFDLLFPVTESPVPSNAELVVGLSGVLGGLQIRIDGYVRDLDHLRLVAGPGHRVSVFQNPEEWLAASAEMRGVEASWSWVRSRGLSVLGGYRWARVEYDVESLGSYVPRFHRDHELELVPSLRRGAHTWSARVSIRSGLRYPFHFPERDRTRLEMYHRVDVGWAHTVGSWTVRAAVANALLNHNAFGILPDAGEPASRWYRRHGLGLLPFLKAELRW